MMDVSSEDEGPVIKPFAEPKAPGKGGRKKPVNPIGYDCINILVQRAIAKVIRKAKSHDRSSRWKAANRDRTKATSANLYQQKREQRIAETTEYRKKNRGHLMAKQIMREKERRDTDEQYHTAILLRQRVRAAIARQANGKTVKNETTAALTGATPGEVAVRLGITAYSIGKASGNDIDHIFPVTKYDLTDPQQQKMCFNISNLQLLNNVKNKSKSDDLPTLAAALTVERWCWPPGVTEDMLN